MKLTLKEQQTLAVYEKSARHWSRSRYRPFWTEEILHLHQLIPKGYLLDIGCGSGRDTKELVQYYQYLGIDLSEGMLKVAQKANPSVTFRKISVYELDFPPDTFDLFWASAILLHLPKDRVDRALQQIHNCIRPGGIGCITLKEGEGERMVDGRLFSFYTKEEFEPILIKNGFTLVDFHVRFEPPPPEPINWLVFYVQREDE